MGRHFKKGTNHGAKLRLLLMMLFAAAAIFAVGRLIPSKQPDEDRTTISEDITKGVLSSEDITIQEPSADVSPDIVSKPQEVISEGPKYPVLPDIPYTPPSGEKPILAIVVDDGGNQMNLTKSIAGLGIPMTWAILPYTRHAVETAKLAESLQIPYILHLPMQAQSDKDGSSEYIVGRGMTRQQIYDATLKALNSLPNPIGLNNHRGSLATSNSEIIEPVIAVLKERGLMFVDSRTSAQSVAYDVARASKVPTLRNRGFLDGSPEKNVIEKRFAEIVKVAVKRGDAVVICHFRPTTVTFLESLARRKDTLPVRLVTIPEMATLLNIGAQ